ncbi:Maf family protein [Niabella drilacis]|uniref:dTTP/UTP pyrophosphatase n=1 Tax=Niabella drilacis (strain DSM 25811 / CCM 8410 / CCUG 62505 / LMG 26954 / E90) TaxID=1285928 RepID=A0A1G6WRP5_NIADE|nr:Maf family protein [Niabella drilacis]SDD68538.1 septum formation protein [Niabella drilacis]
MTANRIVLASSSPRRKQILEWADVPFDILTREIDESFNPELDLRAAVADVALRKAHAVIGEVEQGRIVLAADTVVALNDWVIGKPKSREEAIHMLTRLQDATHQVITGVALVKDQQQILFSDVTEVTFYPLTPRQIVYYIDRYQPFDKAGSYAIQEWIGVTGIKNINGDFYNVMGLPVSRILQEIRKLRYRLAGDD